MSERQTQAQRREFAALLEEHLGPALAFALRLTRERADAEDVLQDSVLRAHRFFDRFERGTNFRAWLFRIVKNTFINAYRKKRARPSEVDFDKLAGSYESLVDETRVARLPNPEESLANAVLGSQVEAGLEAMPREYRVVVHLCLLEGFTYQETADVLEIPIGTVMSRLHRGRKFLQAHLLDEARTRGLVGGDETESARDERRPR